MHQRNRPRFQRKRVTVLFVLALVLVPLSGAEEPAVAWPTDSDPLCERVDELLFNGSQANATVQWQVSLGPRVPESNASLAFREHVNATLSQAGWQVQQTVHERHGMNLTNIEARWTAPGSQGRQVVLAAHYDSRNIADKDLNETNRSLPVPGANDGASGVAVLLELATIVPGLNLSYDVVLFLNDAEDQNQNFTVGAEAWAENLSTEEIANTEAFVLLDMVGDAHLQLRNINPGNETLKERTVRLAEALGLVADTNDCNGAAGLDIVQYDIKVGVLDDHYHTHVRNIPSIDIMDPEYGEPTPYSFGSLWHTTEDTPDKVSATSLEQVGRLVELGLRTGAFVGIVTSEDSTEPQQEEPSTPPSDEEEVEGGGNPRMAMAGLATLFIVSVGLLLLESSRRG